MQSTINQRIKDIVSLTGKSVRFVAKEIGISQASMQSCFTGQTKPSFDTLQKLIETYNINPNWLLMGEGEMQKNNNQIKNLNNNHIQITENIDIDKNYIALYDFSSTARYGSFSEMISNEKIIEKYIIPDFKNVDWMISVRGNSMYPKYSSGDIIGCRVLKESRFIQWGKVYAIATREQGILVKRLQQSEINDCIKAVSDNPNYGAFDIPKNEILGIALVVGMVNLE